MHCRHCERSEAIQQFGILDCRVGFASAALRSQLKPCCNDKVPSPCEVEGWGKGNPFELNLAKLVLEPVEEHQGKRCSDIVATRIQTRTRVKSAIK